VGERPTNAGGGMSAMRDREEDRRLEPRTQTSFFAVELRGTDLYYRLVRNISASGFSFDDRFPLERPGDPIMMEFPLPGSREPIRVSGRVVYARPDRGVGVRIEDVEKDRCAQRMAVRRPARKEPARSLPRFLHSV